MKEAKMNEPIQSLYDAEEALEDCLSFVSFDHAPDGQVMLDGQFTPSHLRALIYIIEHPIKKKNQ